MADADALLTFTVATVWREQRVSCPHQDILRSYEAGSLGDGASAFIRFHLQESQCPYCNAVLEDFHAQQQDAEQPDLEGMKDRLMRSTVAALRRASGA